MGWLVRVFAIFLMSAAARAADYPSTPSCVSSLLLAEGQTLLQSPPAAPQSPSESEIHLVMGAVNRWPRLAMGAAIAYVWREMRKQGIAPLIHLSWSQLSADQLRVAVATMERAHKAHGLAPHFHGRLPADAMNALWKNLMGVLTQILLLRESFPQLGTAASPDVPAHSVALMDDLAETVLEFFTEQAGRRVMEGYRKSLIAGTPGGWEHLRDAASVIESQISIKYEPLYARKLHFLLKVLFKLPRDPVAAVGAIDSFQRP